VSTRFSKSKTDQNILDQGYEGTNIPDDFSIPTCTIEDVDRALFNLFNDEIPFYFQLEKDSRRIPVIFATGERFAILRRRRPLRDKAGALILPLISMMRTGISQEISRGAGPGQAQPLVIKRRLSKEDPVYQRLLNKANLRYQDNLASNQHFSDAPTDTLALPGEVASRRSQPPVSLEVRQGKLLAVKPDNKNIYEVITIPPMKHFMATYEITFWTQYTQQMNDMLTVLMGAYQNMHKRTFRVETDKGYWFVAYVGADLGSNSNFDDFTDNERIVRYTFSVEVPAYVVNPSFPGSPNALRSFMSAPDVVFDIFQVSGQLINREQGGLPSGDPADYVLTDLDDEGAPYPGASILGADGLPAVDPDVDGNNALTQDLTVSLGGAHGGKMRYVAPQLGSNPFTGKELAVPLESQLTTIKGETVYKDLSTGELSPEFTGLTDIDA
jgi:hypothetical protein